ncbi:hypothetical protein PI124_g23648, partial [Phytophthora idaei]
MFVSNKLLALVLAIAAVSSGAHAEQEVAETYGGGGLPGMSGGGLPGMSGGLSSHTNMMPGVGGT